MTAFARAETSADTARLIWEIRSVNHRYLDLNLRLPDECRQYDTEYRTRLSSRLNRGRIDATLKFDRSTTGTTPAVDFDHAAAVVDLYRQMQARFPGLGTPGYADIMRWPGVVQENDLDPAALKQASLDGLDVAVNELVDSRRREGEQLQAMIHERLQACRAEVAKLSENLPGLQARTREKWQAKIAEIAPTADPERVAQEIALILTKADVAEEVDRLVTHFDEVESLLASKKPVGRKLDFLMQELNREANTLGSKSIDEIMTGASIELKVLIEQMREQVQNIE